MNAPAPRPRYVGFHLTNRCDAHCRHCRIWRKPVEAEVEPVLLTKAAQEIREWLGPVEVQVAGGEPLLSPNLEPLIARAGQLGLSTTLTTNGFALTGELARRLALAGLSRLVLSLDGFDHVHNRLRGRDDAFALAQRAIAHATDNGLPVGLNCVLTDLNLDILPGFVAWVAEHPRLDGIFFQALMQPFGEAPREKWWETEPLFPRDGERMAAALRELLAMKRAGFPILNPDPQFPALIDYFRNPGAFALRRCRVGDFGLTIEGGGAIRLCGRFAPVGELRDGYHLRDVYRSPAADQVRRQMAECRVNCHLALNCCFTEEEAG